MTLDVAARTVARDDGQVAYSFLGPPAGDPGDHCPAVRPRARTDLVQKRAGVVEQHRHGRLRPQDQRAIPVRRGQCQIGVQRGGDVSLVPFCVLGDVALHEHHVHRPHGPHPGNLLQQQPTQRQPRDEHAASQRAPVPSNPGQRHAAQRRRARHAVHAEHGRETGQPVVQMSIAEIQPGEAGEEPGKEHIEQHPRPGEGDVAAPAGRRGPAPPAKRQCCVAQGERADEQHHECAGQRRPRVAIDID